MITVKALKQISTANKVYAISETFEMDGKKAEFHASKGNVEVIEKEHKVEGAKSKELKIEAATK